MKKYICFLITPMITVIGSILYLDNVYELFGHLLYIITDFIVCIGLYHILDRAATTQQKKIHPFFCIASLTIIDQGLKFLIHRLDIKTFLVGELIQIRPTRNMNQTGIFNVLNLNFNIVGVIIFKIVCLAVFIVLFIKFKNKYPQVKTAAILLFSAQIANILDSAAWGYTLDYIYFYNLVTYDLKDFYVDAAIGALIPIIFCSDNLIKDNADKTKPEKKL